MRIRAAFLVLIFSMNVIIGLRYSAGACIWALNNEETNSITTHTCCDSFHQKEVGVHRHSKGCTDNCYNGQAIKFSKVDKDTPRSFNILDITFSSAFISNFYIADVLYTYKSFAGANYFVRFNHSPIADIRDAIQSFQI